MERRVFLAALPAIGAVLRAHVSETGAPQDSEFLRALEHTQRMRPRTLLPHARIAAAAEPGTPLTIAGQVFQTDGRSPAPGITVFAYHTDAQGLYDIRSSGPHSWRLKGWALTDAEGRFLFDTIRPAPYPGRNVAAHVHVNLEGPGLKRQSTGILFADDPYVSREEWAESTRAGEFGSVLPVSARGNGQQVQCKIRIAGAGIS